MKANVISKVICPLLIIAILVSGCASSTYLQTTPPHASVHVKGQIIGTTPYTYSDRKMAGSSTLITFKKDGYEDYYTTLSRVEQFNPVALLGIFFVWPLLWSIGYDKVHSYDLEKAEDITQVPSDTDSDEAKVIAQAIPDSNLIKAEVTLKNQRVERLLTQGKIEEALAFSEKQEGSNQSNCFYTIADYYLDKGDYSTAEDFYSRAGDTEAGYVKIAESIMRGEVIDTVLVVNDNKIKSYLEKVYDNEKDVLTHMAVYFEKYAIEKKERCAFIQVIRDQGITSMSSGGKTIDIDKALNLSKLQAVFYYNSALQVCERLNNVEKVEQFKNEIKALDGKLLIPQTTPDSDLKKTEDVKQTTAESELGKTKEVIPTDSNNRTKVDNNASAASEKKKPNSLFPEGEERITLLSATISPETITTSGSEVTIKFKNNESISTENLMPVVVFVTSSMTITTRFYSGNMFNSDNIIFTVSNPQNHDPYNYRSFNQGQLSGSGTIYCYLEDSGESANKEDNIRVSNVLSIYASFK